MNEKLIPLMPVIFTTSVNSTEFQFDALLTKGKNIVASRKAISVSALEAVKSSCFTGDKISSTKGLKMERMKHNPDENFREKSCEVESGIRNEKISYECSPTRVVVGAVACRFRDFQPAVAGNSCHRRHYERHLARACLEKTPRLVVNL
jgi:hypothetical protein